MSKSSQMLFNKQRQLDLDEKIKSIQTNIATIKENMNNNFNEVFKDRIEYSTSNPNLATYFSGNVDNLKTKATQGCYWCKNTIVTGGTQPPFGKGTDGSYYYCLLVFFTNCPIQMAIAYNAAGRLDVTLRMFSNGVWCPWDTRRLGTTDVSRIGPSISQCLYNINNKVSRGELGCVILDNTATDLNTLNIAFNTVHKIRYFATTTIGATASILNTPIKQSFLLRVESIRYAGETDYMCKQTFITCELGITSGTTYERYCTSGTWSAWKITPRFTGTPVSGQLCVTDGTVGGIKSSGTTIDSINTSITNASQGGVYVGASAPASTTKYLAWVDTANGGVLRYRTSTASTTWLFVASQWT